MELQPFERQRKTILAAPLDVGNGVQAVLELFDRPGGFRDDDRRLAAAAGEIGAELLRQALADRQMQQALLDAVAAALDATQSAVGASRPEERKRPACSSLGTRSFFRDRCPSPAILRLCKRLAPTPMERPATNS